MQARIAYIFTLVFLMAWCNLASAQVARLVHYEGLLSDADGQPFTGTKDLTFNLYIRPGADNPAWSEIHHGVEVVDGRFGVLLGGVNPLKLSFYEYFLEVSADGVVPAEPRKMIVGSGYNYRLWFLFAAYTVVWLALFVYMVVLSGKQKRIVSDLRTLSESKREGESIAL